jgi:hypothetical protein
MVVCIAHIHTHIILLFVKKTSDAGRLVKCRAEGLPVL